MNLMVRDPRLNRVINVPNSVRNTYQPVRKNMWGPLLWRTMHSFGRVLKSIGDPDTREKLTRDSSSLFDSLLRTIPCPSCRNHALEYKRHHKIGNGRTSPDTFETWAYVFHNEVNKRIQHVMISREQSNKIHSSYDPIESLREYLRSINSHIRLGVNPDDLINRAKIIIESS